MGGLGNLRRGSRPKQGAAAIVLIIAAKFGICELTARRRLPRDADPKRGRLLQCVGDATASEGTPAGKAAIVESRSQGSSRPFTRSLYN